MLTGLNQPTSGTGTVAGFDICTQHEQIKKHIGYMSQRFSLYEDLTVRENIRLFAGIYGMRDEEIARKTDQLLEQLQFTEHKNDLVGSLPLGWKQKLAFSVSIFHDPDIVFLDEPTGALDEETGRQVLDYIGKLHKQYGFTVIMITHNQNIAEMAKTVIRINSGRITEVYENAQQKTAYEIGW